MPTAPAAPDLFVSTTGCFRTFWSAATNGRPERSAWPPGGYGLTIVIVRDGNGSSAAADTAPSSTRTATARNRVMRPPLCVADPSDLLPVIVAAVDVDQLADHEAGGVGGEEDHDVGDIV